ncbi:CGNR zinc finger domain-containing protein [Streptomyces profundus]|uniref:CGNR zinc finger domain-containing protein n=1 Tax=Streptomyces profundus TaxID=2867410 RepID=UPI001D16C2C3|nr:ABATE domain-containing protein [Streptomyces sp. MA3_2.13]UED83334.1 ABATE domain-containing protein [Streptomyces sp. MA3_2.13]
MATRRHLAVELASTIRHDGHGGVADDLLGPPELEQWVVEHAELFDSRLDIGRFRADDALLAEVLALRQAVRALFAHAVRPGPASPADAHRLLSVDESLARLNEAVAREPLTAWLDWPDGKPPVMVSLSGTDDQGTRLTAALARATIAFLTGPFRERLRACTAPRCVRYFVQGHGRQEWCKPSCADRVRAARHYQRQRAKKPEGEAS